MRLSGLMSGMDTESIIAQLVEAKKTKVTKAVKAQKTLKYKQDAWKDLNKQVLNLYNKSLGNMRFESSFIKKTTKVSNSSIVSVITGEKAMNSVQSLRVTQLARQAFLTGGKLPDTVTVTRKDDNGVDQQVEEAVTGKTTLGELGFSGSGSIKVVTADKTTEITMDANSSISAFVSSLQKAGLTANFDETNHRFYVTSKASGTKNDFSILANDEGGLKALTTLGLSYDSQEVRDSYAKIFGAKDQLDKTDPKYTAMYNNLSVADQALLDAYDPASDMAFDFEALSADGKNKYLSYISEKKIQSRQDDRLRSLSDSWNKLLQEKVDLEADHTSLVGQISGNSVINNTLNQLLSDAGIATDAWSDRAKYESLSEEDKAKVDEALESAFTVAREDGTLTDDDKKALDTLQADWKKNATALSNNAASIEAMKGRLDIDADGTTVNGLSASEAAAIENEVKTAVNVYNSLASAAGTTGASKTAGRDAVIYLNDIEYTSSKNTFEVNGLTLTVSAETTGTEEVTITTEDDTDGIYDMIKGFLKEYNSLINQMDKLYNADSSKGYDPLTDEEKEAMSDSAIEEWENKIKDSILRKDSTLGTFAQAMKTIMMEGVEVNGQKMYLSNFGINTLNYFSAPDNERNAYHIDGDPDDESTSGNADRLKSMIANDPDTVVSFFTQLSQKMYDKMFDLMKGTEYSSSMTVYEDKKMKTDYDDYTAKIKELEKKLADYEDKWYAKFAAMETALAKMQNNASAVTSLLGG